MTDQTRLIKSLSIAWPATTETTAYAVNVLGQLGHHPQFPQAPRYCQLWANVTAGKLLGHDVSRWESDLEREADRLEKHTAEYELTRRQLEAELAESERRIQDSEELMEAIARGELSKEDSTQAIAALQRRAICQAQDEVDEALSRRLGY